MNESRMATTGVPKPAGERIPVKQSGAVFLLAAATGITAGVSALLGLYGGAQPVSFTTFRGGTVDLLGAGIRRR